MNLIPLTGIIAIVGVAVTIASLGYLHIAPTGLSPIRNAVSEYGISPYRRWYRVATIALGIAGLATALILQLALRGTLPAVILLIIFGVARLLISWSPMDAAGAARTRTGRIHNLLAIAAFATATAAGFLAAGPIAADPHWAGFSPAATVFTWVMAVGSAGVILATASAPLRRLFGVFERTIYVGIIGWITVLAIASATAG
ncbi:MAG: DUF998 domain-containing protein [Actinomycetota bacterium]